MPRLYGFLPTSSPVLRVQSKPSLTCRCSRRPLCETGQRGRLMRACAEPADAPSSELYLDDPFGGFKGQRSSESGATWAQSGRRVPLSEKQNVFVRLTGQDSATEPPEADVIVLPGYPCPSFLTRNTTERVAFLRPRVRLASIDWPGIGESDAPQDGIGFTYGVDSALEAVRTVIGELHLGEVAPLIIVGHGFLGTRVGAELAAELGVRACIFLAPVLGGGDASDLPKELRKLRNPLVGPLLTGNPAHMADKVFSSASPYGIAETDMQVLRVPFMRSGSTGFAARAIAMNVNWRAAASDARKAIVALDCPVTFASARGDRWLNADKLKSELTGVASERKASTETIEWEYSGHFIFDDAPEDTAKLIAKTVQNVIAD